jgi:hypothetical protein
VPAQFKPEQSGNKNVGSLSIFSLDATTESPRSGRQRKAWGGSPRIASGKMIKAREAGGSRIIWADVKRCGCHALRGFD